jgi:hypothetical protein
MTTRLLLLHQLDLYLNQQLTLSELVTWAENALIEPSIPEDEDAEIIMDTLTYLGAADTRGFPLTWDILSQFIQRLGGSVRVFVETAGR